MTDTPPHGPGRLGLDFSHFADVVEYDQPFSVRAVPYVRADIADEMLEALKQTRIDTAYTFETGKMIADAIHAYEAKTGES